jgi:proteasome lid subunit RPN8/RPN11
MRGKVKGGILLVDNLLIPPLATHGLGFSGFPRGMIPFDLSIIGVVHSHPSGALIPSVHDLNHFYGKIMAITAYPFRSYSDIAVFNGRGDKIQFEIVPEKTPE